MYVLRPIERVSLFTLQTNISSNVRKLFELYTIGSNTVHIPSPRAKRFCCLIISNRQYILQLNSEIITVTGNQLKNAPTRLKANFWVFRGQIYVNLNVSSTQFDSMLSRFSLPLCQSKSWDFNFGNLKCLKRKPKKLRCSIFSLYFFFFVPDHFSLSVFSQNVGS